MQALNYYEARAEAVVTVLGRWSEWSKQQEVLGFSTVGKKGVSDREHPLARRTSHPSMDVDKNKGGPEEEFHATSTAMGSRDNFLLLIYNKSY